jgi:hypothetical protein
LAQIARGGDFSGHRSFSAAKKRGFWRLLLVHWLKSPGAAISADIVLFPPPKSVVFGGCAAERS